MAFQSLTSHTVQKLKSIYFEVYICIHIAVNTMRTGGERGGGQQCGQLNVFDGKNDSRNGMMTG